VVPIAVARRCRNAGHSDSDCNATPEIALSSEVIEKLRNLLSKSAVLLVVSGPEGQEDKTAHSLLRDNNYTRSKI